MAVYLWITPLSLKLNQSLYTSFYFESKLEALEPTYFISLLILLFTPIPPDSYRDSPKG